MVEEMLAARGISVTHETIRQWGLKFGRVFANRIRQRAPRRGDKWHLDEVVINIARKKHWLWRAVDQQGFVLDVLVQSRRDKKAAKRLFRKLLKKHGRAPRVLVTDKLKSYAAAKREIMPGVEHRQHKGLNNRVDEPSPESGDGVWDVSFGSDRRRLWVGNPGEGQIPTRARRKSVLRGEGRRVRRSRNRKRRYRVSRDGGSRATRALRNRQSQAPA
jgi:putative transposase